MSPGCRPLSASCRPTVLFKVLRRQGHLTPVLLPGESRGRGSPVGCGPWGREESDTTERLHFHFSLSCIGEGNGNPLQCSCLENPGDGGAWWAAVHGVARSRTCLKRLSSSSRTVRLNCFVLCVCVFTHLCEKHHKPTSVQYSIADCVSWVPRLTLLDVGTSWTSVLLRLNSFVCRGLLVLKVH